MFYYIIYSYGCYVYSFNNQCVGVYKSLFQLNEGEFPFRAYIYGMKMSYMIMKISFHVKFFVSCDYFYNQKYFELFWNDYQNNHMKNKIITKNQYKR